MIISWALEHGIHVGSINVIRYVFGKSEEFKCPVFVSELTIHNLIEQSLKNSLSSAEILIELYTGKVMLIDDHLKHSVAHLMNSDAWILDETDLISIYVRNTHDKSNIKRHA